MCICKSCKSKSECGYYDEYIEPVERIVDEVSALGQFSVEPPDYYIKKLESALEGFDCDYFEKEN